MNLARFRANGAFSQRSLSIFGNLNAKAFRRRGCPSSSWRGSADGRVPQPPKMRKISGGPKGKSDLSEKRDRFIKGRPREKLDKTAA